MYITSVSSPVGRSNANGLPDPKEGLGEQGRATLLAEPEVFRACDTLKRNMEVYWTQRASLHSRLHAGNTPAVVVNRGGGITVIVQGAVKKEAVLALKVLNAFEKERGRVYQWQGTTVTLLTQSNPHEGVRQRSWFA